jgi:hypothetical protein
LAENIGIPTIILDVASPCCSDERGTSAIRSHVPAQREYVVAFADEPDDGPDFCPTSTDRALSTRSQRGLGGRVRDDSRESVSSCLCHAMRTHEVRIQEAGYGLLQFGSFH